MNDARQISRSILLLLECCFLDDRLMSWVICRVSSWLNVSPPKSFWSYWQNYLGTFWDLSYCFSRANSMRDEEVSRKYTSIYLTISDSRSQWLRSKRVKILKKAEFLKIWREISFEWIAGRPISAWTQYAIIVCLIEQTWLWFHPRHAWNKRRKCIGIYSPGFPWGGQSSPCIGIWGRKMIVQGIWYTTLCNAASDCWVEANVPIDTHTEELVGFPTHWKDSLTMKSVGRLSVTTNSLLPPPPAHITGLSTETHCKLSRGAYPSFTYRYVRVGCTTPVR